MNHQISQTQIAELPITSSQGRNYQALYTLIPGAANVVEQNSTASNPSRAMSLNVNGVEDMSNTTRIDGAVNYYGWLPYLIAYVPPADSIGTVNITTNSFNAEQGVAGGASINVIIKSGTSQFHGSLWEYNQLFNTNARQYALNTPQVQPVVPKNIFNEFGFSIGGPVYIPKILTGKKKLFFFQDFERTTRRQLITGATDGADDGDVGRRLLGGDRDDDAVRSAAGWGGAVSAGGLAADLPVGVRVQLHSGGAAIVRGGEDAGAADADLEQRCPGTPSAAALAGQLINDYNGSGTLAYNRNTSDSKVT